MEAISAGGILGLLLLVMWAARQHNEVFRVTIRDGRPTLQRGKISPGFLGDMREIVRHVNSGTVRAVKRDGEARLVISSSLDERTAQRLRNAFALDPSRKRL